MTKKGSRTKIIAIIIVILLLAVIGALGFVIYTLLNKTPEEPVRPDRDVSEGLVVDGQVDQKASDVRFTTDMNMTWTFPSGSETSNNAVIGNSTSNLYECYFEVYLEDEERTLLYSSPVLPVGKRLDRLVLDQVLDPGIYDAVCTYHILDDEVEDKELGTVSFRVSLVFME